MGKWNIALIVLMAALSIRWGTRKQYSDRRRQLVVAVASASILASSTLGLLFSVATAISLTMESITQKGKK